ncbi:hypothetical protein DB346_24220 [Verrucomicrobia bacterium LW23]|nr:hypothetical protein DB346_24220 [Verrucomicrobia bacterium LW23]
MDSDAFTTYLRRILCPELSPGDIVILDNLATHKTAAARTLIEARGAHVLYPPTAPTSIPSNKPIPNSKSTCAPSPLAPFMSSSAPSKRPSLLSSPNTATASSNTLNTRLLNWKTL